MSRPYPKIDTLFDRDETFRVDVSRVRRPVFGTISRWVVTEKVDGTCMRVIFSSDIGSLDVEIKGKSDNASIPPKLLSHCVDLANRVDREVRRIMHEHGLSTYTLYGEGYGPKIQNGGRYRPDQGFILFDVGVGQNGTFLSDEQVTETAKTLSIPRVPVIGLMSWAEITALVRSGFPSRAAEEYDPNFLAEGIVARTVEPLYDNRGERLIAKLKTKDFRGGKR